MPLSEHEQRVLDQIERALYAEDPKFASSVRSSDLKTHVVRRIRRAAVLLSLGLVALVVGAATQLWALGVAGFVLMLGAALLIVRSVQRLTARKDGLAVVGADGATGERRRRRGSRRLRRDTSDEPGGLLGRFEARWRRRWEERDR